MVRILQAIIAIIFITASALPQGIQHSFPRVMTNSIKAYPDSNLTIKDTLRLNFFVKGDSTSIPATPSYGQGNLIFRGNLGIFYQYPNGAVRNLDSLSSYVDSARASSIADSAKKVSNSYVRGLLSATSPATYNSSTGVIGADTSILFTQYDATILTLPYTSVNNFPTARLAGRTTASTGALEAITPSATNFTLSGLALNTIQDIHTGASPTFAGLTLSNVVANEVPYASGGGGIDGNPVLTFDGTSFRIGDTGGNDSRFYLYNAGNFSALLKSTNLTADRTFEYPDTAGTLATQQHVGTFYPLKTVTLTAGDGVHGGGDLSANRSFDVAPDFDGGLETVDDSLNIKLFGTTLTKDASGLRADTSILATQYDLTLLGGSGDIEGVTAGDGLGGGGTSGTVTVTANVLTGGGLTIVSDSLRVDTTKMATVYDLSLFRKSDIEGTSSTTHSLTTVASEEVHVVATTDVEVAAGVSGWVRLKYNSVTKDSARVNDVAAVGLYMRYTLQYFQTPGAATANITLDADADINLSNAKIIVDKQPPP